MGGGWGLALGTNYYINLLIRADSTAAQRCWLATPRQERIGGC